ncbi:MAG: TOBE domain-containing protein, partial [Erysipelotrichales bacterium]|nr:TOBE domain-containing protein [Erysipelotrichales bacterium]
NGTADQDIILGVRPDHMTVEENGIDALVDVSELMGPSCHLHMTVDGKDVIAIVPTKGRETSYMGKTIKLNFTGDVCHVFSKETQRNLEY